MHPHGITQSFLENSPTMPLCAGNDKCGNLSADRIEQQIAHLAHPCSVAQIVTSRGVQLGKSLGILHLILS